MTAQQPPSAQRAAFERAVFLQGRQRVLRTRGFEATRMAQPRLKKESIGAHHGQQQLLRGALQSHPRTGGEGPEGHVQALPVCVSAFTKRSNSLRAAWRSASDAADG